MLSANLLTLSDDDARHDALTEIFETRCPPIALESFSRVLKANEIGRGEQEAVANRRMQIANRRRSLVDFNNAVQRDVDRHGEAHPSDLKKAEANKARIAAADKELAALNALRPTPQLNAEALADFLLESKGEFVAAPVEAKLGKGQSPLEALEASRANREALVRDRAKATNALLPFEDGVARLKADVAAYALAPDFGPITKLKAQYTEQGSRRADAQGHVGWPMQDELLDGLRHGEFELGIRFACWAMPEAIIERGTAELRKLYDGKQTLSAKERDEAIACINAKVLAEERREECFVRMCEDAGLTVYRRPLANPLAVLGIAPKKA